MCHISQIQAHAGAHTPGYVGVGAMGEEEVLNVFLGPGGRLGDAVTDGWELGICVP